MKSQISLKDVLLEEAETTFRITENLFRQVGDSELLWKPPTGKNWMTVSQLLMHCASFGCGKAIQGFVKGDWDFPESTSPGDHNLDLHVPPASELAGVDSVAQALELLVQDRILTRACIEEVDETILLAERFTAPWGGPKITLFQHLLLMIAHLAQHKGQLFYYLKLMGKEVNTSDLWGE